MDLPPLHVGKTEVLMLCQIVLVSMLSHAQKLVRYRQLVNVNQALIHIVDLNTVFVYCMKNTRESIQKVKYTLMELHISQSA